MSSSKTKNKNPFKEEPTMKLEENNIIVKRSYKTVYKCDDSIVKVFNDNVVFFKFHGRFLLKT